MIKPVLEIVDAKLCRSFRPQRDKRDGAQYRARRTHPVDVEVGRRVRIRRQQLGMSQTGLAEQLGLTFQQVEKYEKGVNRVSCSKLIEIAKVCRQSRATSSEP